MARLIILRLLESYFRHRWLYLLPAVLMLGVAAVYYLVIAEPVYIVRGVVYVQRDTLLSSLITVREEPFTASTPAQATADEVDELLQTDAFIRSLIEETDLEPRMSLGRSEVQDTIKDVRDAVWVEPQGNNQLEVAAAHEDPDVAYQLASALVDRYVQWRINAEHKESATATAFFEDLITTYRSELETVRGELESYLEAHPEPFFGERPPNEQLEIRRLESDINLAQSRLAAVLDKEENARLATAQAESNVRNAYFLVDAPAPPVESAFSLRTLARNLIIFGGVGLLLSLLGIVGGAVLDRAPRFPLDVEIPTGLPVLAMVPAVDTDAASQVDQADSAAARTTVTPLSPGFSTSERKQ